MYNQKKIDCHERKITSKKYRNTQTKNENTEKSKNKEKQNIIMIINDAQKKH